MASQHQLKQEEELPNSGTNNIERRRKQRLIFQVDEGHKSKQTAIKYRNNFDHFLNFIRIRELDVLLELGKEAIQELVIKYGLSIRDDVEKRYSRSTVITNVAAILYFLESNDIELNKRKLRRYYPSDESTNDDRPYSREEIAKVLSVCDLREKAMILLMTSSGVRIGALCSMQISDLTEVDFQGSKLYKVQVYARTRDKYTTFTTSECYNAIQEYLNFRKRYGEELLLKDKPKPPLFRKHFNKEDPFIINVPKPLSDVSVKKAVDGVLKKSGVKTSECMRSHAFRKGFKSICEQSGMKSINVEMLLGHDIGVSGHYYKPTDDDLLNDYMTHAADALTIDPTQRLEQENQELRKNQKDYLAELGDLRHDFNEMKQLLVHLSKGSQKQLVDEFYQKVGDKADVEWSCD
ncbi:MAG: tyrosine-type recombinase/integrase [Nitrososphaeraceae archaeon]